MSDPARGNDGHRIARPVLAIAALLVVVLIATAGGYGYHRDELYFLVAGEHLAWGYADQGPVTPLLAHAMDLFSPGSLTVLRLPAGLMAGAVVVVAALLVIELGGSRRAQVIAAACTAVASVVVVVGHWLTTTSVDVLAWAVVTWLAARVIRTGDGRLWLAAGAVAGLALLNKPLIAFLLVAMGVGALACGPRALLRDARLWAGVAIALALWAPWVIWQADHDWPQLDVSSSIAEGGSASSQPRWALLPFQLLLVSPVLAPVWIAGLVALWRRPALAPFRLFAAAWVFLVVVFLATGGKPYYLAGLFPVLLAAGAIVVDGWLTAAAGAGRARLLWAAVALSGAVSAVIALPILPARDASPVVDMNGDVGETIGWPELARAVGDAAAQAGPGTVVLTANYGEAGAVARYGPAGLAVHSGHNAFGDWGPPTPPTQRPGPVVTVGIPLARLAPDFDGCRLVARVDNDAGIDNDERGAPIARCTRPRAPWARIWPSLRHLG